MNSFTQHYPFPAPSTAEQYREPVEVCPGVWWIRHPLPFALNHINVWAIAPASPNEGWTLIDTGISQMATQEHWRWLISVFFPTISSQPVKRLIVTHFHPDHLGLASWLVREYSLSLHMAMSEYLAGHAMYHLHAPFTLADELAHMTLHGINNEHRVLLEARQKFYRDHVLGYPEEYHRLMAGDTQHWGGHSWQVLVGIGHSPEHVSLYSESLKCLISGDMLLPKITTNVRVSADQPHANPVKWFTDSLIDLQSQIHPDSLVLPSHGLPFQGAHQRIQSLLEHHAQRKQAIVSWWETIDKIAFQAVALLPVLFSGKMDGHMLFFAVGEAIAHCQELVAEGVLKRQDYSSQVWYGDPHAT